MTRRTSNQHMTTTPNLTQADPTLKSRLATAIAKIRDNYMQDTTDPSSGKKYFRRGANDEGASVKAIEGELVEVLRQAIGDSLPKYEVTASAGQLHRAFVLIPYATIMRKEVTTTPTRGVYIALLFQQDFQALHLTLNQGWEQFKRHFGSTNARHQIKQAASVIGSSLDRPRGFSTGEIRLGATMPFGKGYERGAILSKQYPLGSFTEEVGKVFLDDLQKLLAIYETFPGYALQDSSCFVPLEGDAEESFQDMANASRPNDDKSSPDAPRPRPSPITIAGAVRWLRDVQVAANALKHAGYRCEAHCTSELFMARKGKHAYVEAHHLIPMARQKDFELTIDTQANVVSLCPSCHSKLHRAHPSVRDPVLRQLHEQRSSRLNDCGLTVSDEELLAMY